MAHDICCFALKRFLTLANPIFVCWCLSWIFFIFFLHFMHFFCISCIYNNSHWWVTLFLSCFLFGVLRKLLVSIECFLKQVQKIATGFSFSWLGALFDVNVNENKQIFQYAIEKVNENLLSGEEFQLEGQVADVVYGNEITVSRGLCSLLEVCLLFGIFF